MTAARRSRPPAPPGAGLSPGHLSPPSGNIDAQLATMAAGCHLVFSLAELGAIGLTRGAAARRVVAGRLHRVHHGVYSLVPPPLLRVNGRYRAATLACTGTRHRAALSHRSAADLHGLRECHRRTVEVIVPGRSTHRHPGIQTHRSVHLDDSDLVMVDGILVTSVARTLLDLAAVVPRRALQRALDQAEMLRVLDLDALVEQRHRNRAHPGAGRLRAVLAEHVAGETVTDSGLEERMHGLLTRHYLPAAEHHGAIDPGDGEPILRPDFVWRASRVVAELDGAGVHLTRRAFEQDRRRDQRLVAAGWTVVRITWRQLRDEPTRVAALLGDLLRL